MLIIIIKTNKQTNKQKAKQNMTKTFTLKKATCAFGFIPFESQENSGRRTRYAHKNTRNT